MFKKSVYTSKDITDITREMDRVIGVLVFGGVMTEKYASGLNDKLVTVRVMAAKKRLHFHLSNLKRFDGKFYKKDKGEDIYRLKTDAQKAAEKWATKGYRSRIYAFGRNPGYYAVYRLKVK